MKYDQEYIDSATVTHIFGLKRGLQYLLVNEGKIKSKSLSRDGKRGKRLFCIKSIRDYLKSCEE